MKLCEGAMMLVAPLPLLRLLGMIAALTKDKNAVVALNNVNGGCK